MMVCVYTYTVYIHNIHRCVCVYISNYISIMLLLYCFFLEWVCIKYYKTIQDWTTIVRGLLDKRFGSLETNVPAQPTLPTLYLILPTIAPSVNGELFKTGTR